MKIISLRGENLASLRAPFSIDFSEGVLADAGLFAICGNTGSGKSTLLDAICLSLFDAMPRFSNSRRGPAIGHAQSEVNERLKSNDVRHIMTRGAGTCFSQVVFELDDGSHYQATWTLKRARNSASGRFQAQEMELLSLKSGQVVATKKTEVLAYIEQLIGLNYEQFRRSVLLAQGDFAAFLKAPAKERSDLLERITGTEIYSTISKLTHQTAKESEQQLALLQAQLGEVSLLSAPEQQVLSQKIGEINDALNKVAQQQNQLQWLEQYVDQREQLASQLAEGDIALDKVVQQWEGQVQARELLVDIESAQEARVTFVQQQQNEKQLLSLNSQQQEAVTQLETKKTSVNQTQVQLQQLEGLSKQSQLDYEQRAPQLELAVMRQSDIAHLSDKLEQDGAQIQLVEDQKQQISTRLSDNVQQLSLNQKTLSAVAQYLSGHQALAPLVNNFGAIEQGISDYQQLNAQCHQYREKIQTSESSLIVQKDQLVNAKQTAVNQQKEINQYQLQLNQYAALFEGADLAQIEQRQTDLQQQYNSATMQLQLVMQGLEYHVMIANKQNQSSEIIEHLAQLRGQYQQVKQALNLHTPVLDEAQKSLNQARNVMSLHDHRQQLIDGEECALCGSCEHPYAKEQNIGEVLVEQLHQRYQQLLNESNELGKQLAKLDAIGQEQAALQQSIAGEIEQLAQSANELGCDDISVTAQAQLEAAIAQIKQHIEQAKIQYQQTVNQVEQAREVEQQLTELTHQFELTQQGCENTNNSIATMASEQLLDNQYLTQYLGQLDLAIEKLRQHYPQANWPVLLQDEQQLALFTQNVSADILQFTTKSEEHQQLTLTLREAEQSQVMLTEQSHQMTLQLKPMLNQLQQDQKVLAQWQAELDQLMAGEDPALQKKALESQLHQMMQALQNAQSALHLGHNELAVLESKIAQFSHQQSELMEQQTLLASDWLGWQATLELSDSKLVELLSYASSWIVDTKKELTALQQSLHQHQAVISQLKRQLEQVNLKLSQREPLLLEQLPSLAPVPQVATSQQRAMLTESINAQQQSLNQEQFGYRSQLEMHNQAMLRFGQLQQEIEQQTIETTLWLDMKELIGSADGAKFRTFAQSLTLEQMLVSANHHLQELAPRYQLQAVPSSELDLQMIDMDMGDEVRSVDSLSGGECFLVSLALALGLGSITSLHTSINTLFIDEGFGTLDPDTLEVALSCLDSLQASGRQIGIISHVQGLVERVGTRIQITAHGSGQSSIELLAR